MADSTSISGDRKHEGHTPKLEGSTKLRASICCVTRLIRERPLIVNNYNFVACPYDSLII